LFVLVYFKKSQNKIFSSFLKISVITF